jgi:L-rhamnose mutarotase
MKDIIIIVSLFVLVLNASNNLRNLLLGKDPVKYAVLIDAANQTFYQMYNLTLNFRDRYEAMVNDSQKRLRVIVDEYDPLIPPSSPNVTFTVLNGKPPLNDILKDLSNLYEINDTDLNSMEIFGNYFNIIEEFKLLSNQIAAGFDYGTVIIYKPTFTVVAQVRYKCFITDKDGVEYGSFEIIQEDKNDKQEVKEVTESWWNKVEKFADKLKDVKDVIQTVGGVVSSAIGIFEICKNAYDKYKTPKNETNNDALYLKRTSFIFFGSLAALL